MKRLVSRIALFVSLAAASLAAGAQAWPSKPVKIIVPFAAGGTTDVVARLLGQKLGDVWGTTVVVEDRAGAGGNIGADAAAHSPPDGYTLFMTSGSIVTANPYMYKSLTYDAARDLVPVSGVATGPQIVVVNPASPFKDLREFIAYAKANPKKINFGSAGFGTQTHLATENFAYAAGIDMTHVPYKGESTALTDLMGGQIHMVTPNLTAAINLVQQGKLRALAVMSRERIPQLPDVPAVAETLPGFENAGWFALMAPAGTPREVIDRIHRDTAKILQSDDFRAKLAQQGMTPQLASPAELGALIHEESARWARVIRERGLQAN
ncbi:MAG: Bug family tripartite tricarboxylate transporter substrate binding protein [Usitatibacter sp.]